jgi:hypothetical protein
VNPRSPSSRYGRPALLAALLILPGLWLRFHALEWMEFAGDELMTMVEPYRAAHGYFRPHGILTSLGISPPNFLLYVLALPVSLSREPTRVVLFVALWNLVGLACVLRFLWRVAPPAVALCGTALFASMPGALLLSRKIWNPDFLPASVALLILLLALQCERPRRGMTVALFGIGALVCGFHLTAVALLPCVLLWAWLVRMPLGKREVWIGTSLVLALFAPYVVFLFSSGFDDLREAALMHGTSRPSDTTRLEILVEHFTAAIECSTTGGLLGGARIWTWIARGFSAWTAAAVLITGLRALWLAWQGATLSTFDKLLALGGLFEVVLLALYTLVPVGTVPHYYAVLIPFPLLSAVWLGWRLSQRIGEWPLVGATALVVAAHTLLFAGHLAALQRGETPPGPRSTPSFAAQPDRWRDEIGRRFDEIDSGYAEKRAEQQRLRTLFEASTDVLLRYDARRDEPPASAQGKLALEPGPEGLLVSGSTALDMLRLPAFDLEGRGHALLKLEIRAPKDVIGCVFYASRTDPGYDRTRALSLELEPGENTVYLRMPESDAAGRPMVRLFAARWLLRAAELRRSAD